MKYSRARPQTQAGFHLEEILRTQGYVGPRGGIAIDWAAADIARRTKRRFTASRLRALLRFGSEMLFEESVVICQGLDITPYDLVYGPEDPVPQPKWRPPAVNLLEVVDLPWE